MRGFEPLSHHFSQSCSFSLLFVPLVAAHHYFRLICFLYLLPAAELLRQGAGWQERQEGYRRDKKRDEDTITRTRLPFHLFPPLMLFGLA